MGVRGGRLVTSGCRVSDSGDGGRLLPGSGRPRRQTSAPLLSGQKQFRAPQRAGVLGFIGHGNDPKLFSISKFAHAWACSLALRSAGSRDCGEICGSLTGLDLPGVSLAGYVPDIEAFYEGIDAVIAPMLMGSGLKMKVAEALSMGRPVIGTRIAFEGFDVSNRLTDWTRFSDAVSTILRLHNDA